MQKHLQGYPHKWQSHSQEARWKVFINMNSCRRTRKKVANIPSFQVFHLVKLVVLMVLMVRTFFAVDILIVGQGGCSSLRVVVVVATLVSRQEEISSPPPLGHKHTCFAFQILFVMSRCCLVFGKNRRIVVIQVSGASHEKAGQAI